MRFYVTLRLSYGDGDDVCVDVDVTENEFRRLKQCYRDDNNIGDCWGLKNLTRRIKRAALKESKSGMTDFISGKRTYYSNVSYMIDIPDEVIEAAEEEDRQISMQQ